jgi:hypothetical protein
MMRELSIVVLGVCAAAAIAVAPCAAQDQPEGFIKEPIPEIEKEVEASEPEHSTPLHFVVDLNMNNIYYTPRGLVVQRTGASFHLLALGILDLYKDSKGPILNGVTLTAGAWNNFQTSFDRSPYNEVDPIIGVDFTLWKDLTLGATFVPFISPPNLFPGGTEFNFEFKIAYDDTELLGPFALHPYLKPFWHFSGPSPVVLGQSDAWDFETGISPGVQLFQDTDWPLRINMPTFAAWGGKAWYGGPGTFLGHVSTGLTFTLPLTKFISPDNGIWSLYAGYAYTRIVNDNLFMGGNIVSGNDKRDINLVTGGVNFFMP